MNKYKTIKISPELHKRLKMYCVTEGLKLNEWIERQMQKIIEQNENKME